MSFQRSYSKVWWDSDNQLPSMTANSNRFNGSNFYSFYRQQPQQRQKQQQPQSIPEQQQRHQQQQFYFKIGNSDATSHHHLSAHLELDGNNFRSFPGNLSRIQEVEDERNASKLSWEKRDSPGSLRSQDSGFSDNEESHGTRKALGGGAIDTDGIASSTPASSPHKSTQSFDSPTSLRDERVAETPPTVIRRVGKSEFYSSLVNVSRRISFSGSPASSGRITNESKRKLEQPNGIKGSEMNQDKEYIEEEDVKDSKLMRELDSMHLVDDAEVTRDRNKMFKVAEHVTKARRRRRLSRRPTLALSLLRKRCNSVDNSSEEEGEEEENKDYNGHRSRNSMRRSRSLDDLETECNPKNTVSTDCTNRGAYLDEPPPAYNNETIILDSTSMRENVNNNDFMSSLKEQHPLRGTSTPKIGRKLRNNQTSVILDSSPTPPVSLFHFEGLPLDLNCQEYSNPLLNGHDPALQFWIGNLRTSYEHEVMSTLQTKSIAAEAFKNFTITTNTVAKIIRQLQQRAQHLQLNFEAMERILKGEQAASLAEAFDAATKLVNQVEEFSQVLQRRAVFFTESPKDRRRYEQSLERIKLIAKDTRISLEKRHYINLESLLEDLLVLKRNLLVALRLVFEKLVRVIVQSIEHSRCDLMLRANINMIATLTNIDYDGFASLTDAFVQNEAVRALLIVCLDHRLSSVRALALRALATICCAPASIEQLGACGGVEILRDILQVKDESDSINENESEVVSSGRVTNVERREAVSLLTQITAAWHGPDHRVDGLRDSAEAIIEGLTVLMTRARCPQTLLLCAAAMNNLSRIEVTSHYSIMSNEAIYKWIEIVQKQQEIQENHQPTSFESVSVFLYEQLATMLYNMSLNKKCHSHLANGTVINFISSVYHEEFYRVYESRAQRDSQRRIIKAILHTLTRLVQESTLGPELLELEGIPVLLRTTLASVNASNARNESVRSAHDSNLTLGRVPLFQQKYEQRTGVLPQIATPSIVENGSGYDDGHKLQPLSRQESYV